MGNKKTDEKKKMQYFGAMETIMEIQKIWAFRISDLIKELQKAKRKHGDLEILIHKKCRCDPEYWKFVKIDSSFSGIGEGKILIEADKEKLKGD